MRLRRTDAAGGRGMKIAHTNIEKKKKVDNRQFQEEERKKTPKINFTVGR